LRKNQKQASDILLHCVNPPEALCQVMSIGTCRERIWLSGSWCQYVTDLLILKILGYPCFIMKDYQQTLQARRDVWLSCNLAGSWPTRI